MNTSHENLSIRHIPEFFDILNDKPFLEAATGLMAFKFRKLMDYNPSWTISRIMVYEFLLQASLELGGGPIGIDVNSMARTLRLSDREALSYMQDFKKSGYIKLTIKRIGRKDSLIEEKIIYEVHINFSKIKESLMDIYNFSEHKPSEIDTAVTELSKYYSEFAKFIVVTGGLSLHEGVQILNQV